MSMLQAGKGLLLFCLLAVAMSPVRGGGWDLNGLLGRAHDIAHSLGCQSSGQIDRGSGRMVNWSYQGMLVGFEWKYMAVCIDSTTGESVSVMKQSKTGSVEHCLRQLFERLASKQKL